MLSSIESPRIRGLDIAGEETTRRPARTNRTTRASFERRRLLVAAVAGLFVVLLACSAVLIRHLEEARRASAMDAQAATEARARVAALATTTMLESSTGSIPDDIVRAQRLMSRLAVSGDLQDIQLGLYFVPRGRSDAQSGLLVASSATRDSDRPFGALSERSGLDVAELLRSTCRAEPPLPRPARWSYASDGHVLSLLPMVTASGCWGVVTLRPAAAPAPLSLGIALPVGLADPVTALALLLGAVALAYLLYQFRHVLALMWGITELPGAVAAAGPGQRMPLHGGSAHGRLFAPAPATGPAIAGRQRPAVGMDRDALEELAHGLKTPVATIIQSLEPLRRNLASEDPGSLRSLQIIETASRRLIDLIQAIPGQAAGKTETNDGRLAGVADIVHSAVAGLDAPHNGVRLRIIDMTQSNPLLAGDPALLRAAIEHVVENALDFSPAGGEVCVRVTSGRSLAILAIEDEGPGVTPASLPKIFNRYFSDRSHQSGADDKSAAPSQGTPNFGLGLWIARRNVEALRGRIFAENRRSGGLRVTISLPIAQLGER